MKDTNFDSIKEKFDNSGVNAPDALNEELLLEKLNNAAPVEMLPPKKSKKRIAAGISAAAAVALVTAGAFTFTNVFGNQPQPKELTAYHTAAGLRGFKNVDELKALMRDALTAQENNNRFGGTPTDSAGSYGLKVICEADGKIWGETVTVIMDNMEEQAVAWYDTLGEIISETKNVSARREYYDDDTSRLLITRIGTKIADTAKGEAWHVCVNESCHHKVQVTLPEEQEEA